MSTTDRDRDLCSADEAARAVARCTFDVPLLLEAGAGTGKTTTLIARLVTWTLGPGWERAAAECKDSDEARVARTVLDGIVAITFTEAAASEMGHRLESAYRQLAESRTFDDVPRGSAGVDLPRDLATRRARASSLARALDRPVVHTIHAFCRGLLAEHPFEARLSPNFDVDADGSALERIAREVLETELGTQLASEPDASIARLLARDIGPVRLQEALSKLASNGRRAGDLEVDPYTPERVAPLVDALSARVREFLEGPGVHLAKVGARSKVTVRVLDELRTVVDALPTARPISIEALDATAELLRGRWSETSRKRLHEWADGTFNASETKCLGDEEPLLPARAAALEREIDVFRRMHPLLQDSARRTLSVLLARVRAELVSHGIESYTDLLHDARQLVRDNPRVVAGLRARIRQLVVDEFQDTDRLQCELIRRIALDDVPGTETPGLFLVGDPKQSIYGWRNADLEAYEGFAEEIEKHGGRRERLSVNHRSTRRILAEVERAMSPIMHAHAGLQPAFEPLVASRDVDGSPVERVVPWRLDVNASHAFGETTKKGSRSIEADWIASDLVRQHAGGAPWRDMAILLRATGDLDMYLSALRAQAVPYEVAGDKSFYQRREIIEASVLVRTIVDPRDHVALVALLRSSLVGVPDAALIPLWRHGFHEHVTELCAPADASVRAALCAVEAALPEVPRDVPGIERVAEFGASLVAAIHAIARARHSLAHDPSDVFVEELRTLFLVESRAAALYLGPYRVSNLERFFRRLAEELDEHGADVQSCLRALRTASSERREAEEARPKDSALDAVQVLTIHKAKGLDFAHVYVADLDRGSPAGHVPICDVESVNGRTSYAFFGTATPGYEDVESARERVAAAERVRTLYVAMTRARERLVLSGPLPTGPHAPPWDKCKSHMQLLAHSIAEGVRAQLEAAHAAGESSRTIGDNLWILPGSTRPASTTTRSTDEAGDEVDVERSIFALANARAAAQARMQRPWSSAASASVDHGPAVGVESTSRLDRNEATAIGRAFHRLLEALAAPSGATADKTQLRALLTRSLERELNSVPSARALAQAAALLDRFVAGALHEKLTQLGSDVLARELPVILPPSSEDAATRFVSGTIDLVYRERSTGEIVIADYKTDSAPAELAVARYAAQGRAYQRAVRDALELDRDPRFELWFVAQDRIEVVA